MEQFNVTGMSCAACSARVEKAVKKVPGVTSCSVSLLTNSMGVEGTATDAAIIQAVQEAGYGASPKKAGGAAAGSTSPDLDALADHETPKLKRRLIASLGFLLVLIGSSNPMQSVFFLLFILILQQLDGNVIGPFILGQYVGMDSIWILFALLLFGGIFGVVGLVIGVPLLAVMFWFARGIMEKKLEEKGRSTDWRDYASSHNPLLTNQSYFSEKLRRLRENIGNFFHHFSLLGSLKWIFGKVGDMLVFLLKMIFEFLKNLLLWILNWLDKEDNSHPPEQDGKPKS